MIFLYCYAKIISDHDLRILHIDAHHPGGAYDAFVFQVSDPGISLEAVEAGEAPKNIWLLGEIYNIYVI